MHRYDLIAEWYASDRDHGTGIPEVTALSDSLPRGATVLDVGCESPSRVPCLLRVDGYRAVLARNGFALEDVHTDPGQNVYYLARRVRERQG